MALMVFFSAMSFTVEKHFCGDILVDYSFFGNTETCGMEVQQDTSCLKEYNLKEENCCSDETLTVEGQNELKISFHDLTFDQQLFITSFGYSFINLFEGLEENITPFEHYPPPVLVRNIIVLDQTFLI